VVAKQQPGNDNSVAGCWVELVKQCAIAAGRNPNNLKCYTGASTLQRQLECLGEDNAKEMLEIAKKLDLMPGKPTPPLNACACISVAQQVAVLISDLPVGCACRGSDSSR
jgi:hypothetical protein